MKAYLTETAIVAISQEVTRLLLEKYYHALKLPETSEQQVERVMGELQPRGANDPELDKKIDALQHGYEG